MPLTANLPLGPLRLWAAPLAVAGVAIVLTTVGTMSSFGNGWLLLQYPGFILIATLLPLIWRSPVQSWHIGLALPLGLGRTLILTIGGTFFLIATGFIFEQSSPQAAQSAVTVLENLRAETSSDILLLLEVTALGPLAEEAIFRAALFRALYDGLRHLMKTETVPLVAALTISAVAFAMAHMVPGQEHQQIALFLHGVIYAGLFAITGSLYAPILAHSLNNAATAVQLYVNGAFTGAGHEVVLVSLVGPMIALGLAFLWQRLLAD